jgi:diguanylate cyclase (GGDEF)-like protein
MSDGSADIPKHSMTSLSMRKEKFPRERSNFALRAQVEDLQLADLVGNFGILNRRAIDTRLQKMAMRIIQGNLDDVQGLAVAYGDLDGLKLINGVGGQDKGHDMGDAAVVNVAEHMSKVRPNQDVVARLGGGDEFGTIMKAATEDAARMLMVGKDGRDGYIQRTQKAVAEGREKLKKHFGDRWVQDLPDKKPGNVTMGWNFLTREAFVDLYNNWRRDVQNQKPGVGDFSTYVFGGADKSMFENKT